jgi:hypothetical protein
MQPALHAQDYKMLTCSSLQVDLDTLPFVAFHKGADVHHNRHGLSTSALWLRLQVLNNVAATFQTHINLPSPIDFFSPQAYTYIPLTCGAFVWTYWAFYLHLRTALKRDRCNCHQNLS